MSSNPNTLKKKKEKKEQKKDRERENSFAKKAKELGSMAQVKAPNSITSMAKKK
jgi:hypothetical protein